MTPEPYFFYIVCYPVIHRLGVNYDILLMTCKGMA